MGYLLARLSITAILNVASISLCISALALPRWVYHRNLDSTTTQGLSRICTDGVCLSQVISEYFSYTLIMVCFAVLVQIITLVSVLMGIRVHYLNAADGFCQWDIVARFGLCSSLTSLCIASFLFSLGLQDSYDNYGGNFAFQGILVRNIRSDSSLGAGPGPSHYFLSASIGLNVMCLFPLVGMNLF